MKRLVIVAIALVVRLVQADTPWSFQGRVVDGLDRPIEGALIRVYNGHAGLDNFEVDFESVVTSRCDGTFAGYVSGDHDTTYRRVTQAPYDPVEACGGWCTNGIVRLLRKRQFTTDEVVQLASADGSMLYSNVLFVLGYDWSFEKPLSLFPLGSRVRPAVLKALGHPSEHIRTGAKRLLEQHIFHPEDMDDAADNGPKSPKEAFKHADMDHVIKEAVTFVTENNRYAKSTTPRCLMNKDGCEALAFFDASSIVNGHKASFYLHLSQEQSVWRFDYWGISLIE